ncbi:hypothetical protein [Xanthovirga aplysinae]|uniref:hypothetical protein n=1 Tax=Xanthovirga aplysinae TaxID=2529853 RepID=UPI0012BD4FEA|nr:hypothetical protein [Xanthovirga aplysinae]MTI29931.1 hypothetical protein [Xanthovirga aplysinae]
MSTQEQTPKSDVSKECQINNETDSDIVVITPTTVRKHNSESPFPKSAYNQDLEVLTTLEGGQVIPAGKSGTVVLDKSYIDPITGESTYSMVYKLLVSSANSYYPIANINTIQNRSSGSAKFDPQTVGPKDQESMKETALFIQTIHAYPNSQLAMDFKAAMPDKNKSNTKAMIDAANTFFKSTTTQFQNVRLLSLIAMHSYYKKFPFVWANFTNVTYYLYSGNDQSSNFVGQLSMNKPSIIDLTAPNAAYEISFSPASSLSDPTSIEVDSSKMKLLTYSNDIFVNDENEGTPEISLKGTFMPRSFLSQNPDDTQIIRILSGMVNGVTVTGTMERLPLDQG